MAMMPVIDFPLYGLNATWSQGRWLQMVEGQMGQPTWGVWLGHDSTGDLDAAVPWALVGTLPRARHAQIMTPGGGDSVREVAYAGMLVLVNVTLPPPPEGRRTEPDLPGLVSLASSAADNYAKWPRTSWEMDGRPVSARYFQRQDAWFGFTTDLPEVEVCVVASCLDKNHLGLSEVVDSAAYNFDAAAPIALDGTLRKSCAAAFNTPGA